MRRNLLMTAVFCGVAWLVAAASCRADAWYIQRVDNPYDIGEFASLTLDTTGYPHISYFDRTHYVLRHAAWDGSGWHIDAVNGPWDGGEFSSIALDPAGPYRYIAYYAFYDLKLAVWDGFTWQMQTVDSAGDVGAHCSVALHANGYPHISYYDHTNGRLKYAAWRGTSWQIEIVDSPGHFCSFSSLVLDDADRPHISYHSYADADTSELRYAYKDGGGWHVEAVDSEGDVGYYTSLELDADGRPHITYHKRTGGDLKYANWDGAAWHIQTVDGPAHVGAHTSLELDADGYPQIAYYDVTNGDAKYAAWNGSAWDLQVIDSPGDVGWYTSMALDDSGLAHVAYYDVSNGDLKYATTRAPAEASHELPATGYYMISFPLIPPSPTPDALLSDDLGDGGYYMWRWEAGGYQTVPTSAPASQTTTLDMQEGYWLLAPASTIDMTGAQAITDQVIPLQTGWNMVAAPHEATMDSLLVDNAGDVRSLAEAQSAAWVLATFYYSHDGTGGYNTLTVGQTPADTLSLWVGYWVLAGIDCSLIVPVAPPAGPTATTAALRETARFAWAFDIQASSGSSADSITIAAADPASEGFDGFALDKPKPPAPPGESRLRMVLTPDAPFVGRGCPTTLRSRASLRSTSSPPALATSSPLTTSELAMETKGTGQEGLEWDFTLTGGVEGDTVTLSWPELSLLPKDRVAILTDHDSGKRTFMRTRAQCEFAAPGAGTTRNFSVTVKRVEDGALFITALTAVPTRGGTWDIGFNLSADAAVTARVYNVAGRRVADIAQSEQLARARATLTWNARSLTGTAVPSGTYVLSVTARTEDGEHASAVALLQVRR